MKCFLDFKPGGGLCNILAAVFRFKTEQGWCVQDSCYIDTYLYYTCPKDELLLKMITELLICWSSFVN